MPAFNGDIRMLAKENTDFRREFVTNVHSQLVLMCLQPDDDLGMESFGADQVLVVVKGKGEAVVGGETVALGKGQLLVIPAGSRHNVINTGYKPLQLYSLYAPPRITPGTVHGTKADADAAERVAEG